jgi:hypothetical protein
LSELALPTSAFEALTLEHRTELAKVRMQLVIYRKCLEEHGIEPPDKDGAELLEMYRHCSAVITTASDFVSHLGSAKELLMGSWK